MMSRENPLNLAYGRRKSNMIVYYSAENDMQYHNQKVLNKCGLYWV